MLRIKAGAAANVQAGSSKRPPSSSPGSVAGPARSSMGRSMQNIQKDYKRKLDALEESSSVIQKGSGGYTALKFALALHESSAGSRPTDMPVAEFVPTMTVLETAIITEVRFTAASCPSRWPAPSPALFLPPLFLLLLFPTLIETATPAGRGQ